MGLVADGDEMEVDGIGIPDEDPDATPPGRAAVSYSTAGDSLFSPPVPPVALEAPGSSGDGEHDEDASAGSDALPDGLLGLLGDPMGALGAGAPALIANLEAMAEEFERQSGEPEVEIRAKIAMLRGVLDSRPGAVAQSRARMDVATAALGAEASNGAGDAAMHSVCASTVNSIEGNLSRVEASLQADPAAAAMVSSMLGGAQK
jgi:hypothetical protein